MTLDFIKGILLFFTTMDYSGVSLILLFAVMGLIIYKLHKSDKAHFSFDQMLVDENGKTSTSKVFSLFAFSVSTWAFIYLTMKSLMTEWFFIGYMSVWVLNRGISKFTDLKAIIETPK